jgi:HTH-type transcriptional regulator/antitoxin HigA
MPKQMPDQIAESRTYAAGKRPESDLLVHPGELLLEELEVRGMTQRDLAETTGRPAQAINEIVKGKKAITAATALDLEAALGIPAQLWLNMQTTYDLRRERQARDLAAAPRPRLRRVAEE